MFEGTIIKESLKSDEVLDEIVISDVQIWKTDGYPRYWTAVFFTSTDDRLPELRRSSLLEHWYVDMKRDRVKYIVFSDAIYSYRIGDETRKNEILDSLRKRGLPEKQLDWAE